MALYRRTPPWAPYIDGANFASRIECPVRIAVGFSDTTCPPCAVYAAYNEIPVRDKVIMHGIGMTHNCRPQFYKELGEWLQESMSVGSPYFVRQVIVMFGDCWRHSLVVNP